MKQLIKVSLHSELTIWVGSSSGMLVRSTSGGLDMDVYPESRSWESLVSSSSFISILTTLRSIGVSCSMTGIPGVNSYCTGFCWMSWSGCLRSLLMGTSWQVTNSEPSASSTKPPHLTDALNPNLVLCIKWCNGYDTTFRKWTKTYQLLFRETTAAG